MKTVIGVLAFCFAILSNASHAQAQLGNFPSFPGDFNFDGRVDVLDDVFTLVGNLGTEGEYSDGDFTGDGYIDGVDLDWFLFFDTLGTSNVLPGDANRDGVVDILGDGYLIVGNLGTVTDTFPIIDGWEQGDINSDGLVNGRDLSLLLDILQN